MSIPHELLATIARRLDPARGPAAVDDAIALWHTLMTKFGPLLGPLSTELLLVRALEASAASFPWLDCAHERDIAQPPFEALRRCLAPRAPGEIVEANRAMCTAFVEQLAGLIGVRLAAQLLQAAFTDGATETGEQAARA